MSDFPPWDDNQRPSCGADGRQLAPETFKRWLLPACWEDTDGASHFDVRAFHRWLGWPLNEEEVRDTATTFYELFSRHLVKAGHPGEMIVER